MPSPSISRQFAKWAFQLRYEDLSPEVIDKIKAFIMHGLTGGMLGIHSHHAQNIAALTLKEESHPHGAHIFHHHQKATRIGAAFANSELIHASNLFDSYRMLNHPGPVMIPVTLANAEFENRSGKELITALAIGYEFICRLSDDFIPSTAARGFRPGPIYSTLGGALASGKLLGLSEDGLVSTIALAANFASGLNEGPRTGGNELLIHEPQAARNAVFAAMMAREGIIKGAEYTIEGDAGFYNAFTGNNQGKQTYSFKNQAVVDFASITQGLGHDYKLLTLMFRMYPLAGYNQPVIELMKEMVFKHSIKATDIEAIEVSMNWIETLYPSPEFPRHENWQEPKPLTTTHYYAAYTAVHGSFPIAGSDINHPNAPSRELDPEVLSMMNRVSLVPEKDRAMFSPSIAVNLSNGQTYREDYPYERMVWGLEQLSIRLLDCLPSFASGRTGFDELHQTVQHFDTLPNMNEVFRLMHSAP